MSNTNGGIVNQTEQLIRNLRFNDAINGAEMSALIAALYEDIADAAQPQPVLDRETVARWFCKVDGKVHWTAHIPAVYYELADVFIAAVGARSEADVAAEQHRKDTEAVEAALLKLIGRDPIGMSGTHGPSTSIRAALDAADPVQVSGEKPPRGQRVLWDGSPLGEQQASAPGDALDRWTKRQQSTEGW